MTRRPETPLTVRALVFATNAHCSIGQRRKYTDEPYIVHPIAVADIISTLHCRPEMIAAAYLHDVVEDTPVTLAEIVAEFGDDVGSLVSELTDVSKPGDGNRAARKAADRQHIAQASADGQTIKLADLIDNSHSITAHDPGFAARYMREKRALLEVMVRGDARLRDWAWAIVRAWEEAKP